MHIQSFQSIWIQHVQLIHLKLKLVCRKLRGQLSVGKLRGAYA